MIVDVAADKTIIDLMDIVKSSDEALHVLHEVAITLTTILRKYPQKYKIEHCVQTMVSKLGKIIKP